MRAAFKARFVPVGFRQQIAALETAEAKRQKVLIQSAVERLVATVAVHAGDHFGQFRVLEQLVKDPSLCSLALMKRVFRAGQAWSLKQKRLSRGSLHPACSAASGEHHGSTQKEQHTH